MVPEVGLTFTVPEKRKASKKEESYGGESAPIKWLAGSQAQQQETTTTVQIDGIKPALVIPMDGGTGIGCYPQVPAPMGNNR